MSFKQSNKPVYAHPSEYQFCKQFKCRFVEDLQLQYKDIDAISPKGNSISIKSQEIAVKTGNFSFEFELQDTRTGDKRIGNFLACQADYYAITNGSQWFVFKHSDIVSYINDNKSKITVKHTSEKLEENNRKQGRKYDRGYSYMIPVTIIAQFSHVFNVDKD